VEGDLCIRTEAKNALRAGSVPEQRVPGRTGADETAEISPAPLDAAKEMYLGRLLVRGDGRIQVVRVDDVDWIEASGHTVRIHVGKVVRVVRASLRSLEERLDPAKFVRVHRSAIVNLDRIPELELLFHGEAIVVLRDEQRLTVSRHFRMRLEQVLGKPA